MTYQDAVLLGNDIIPLIDDEDFLSVSKGRQEYKEAIRAILTADDSEDDDEASRDAIRALEALKTAYKGK